MFFSKNFHPKFYITPDVSPGTQRALRGRPLMTLRSASCMTSGQVTVSPRGLKGRYKMCKKSPNF